MISVLGEPKSEPRATPAHPGAYWIREAGPLVSLAIGSSPTNCIGFIRARAISSLAYSLLPYGSGDRSQGGRSMNTAFRKILAPVYFDEISPAALDYAAYFADRDDGTVFLLHVVPTDEPHLLRGVYRPDEGGGANVEWAEKMAREKLEAIAKDRLKHVRCEVLTHVNWDAATGILEEQRRIDADLITMATHGRTGISRLVLRSVAERVVRESPRPVLISQRKIVVSAQRPFRSILCPVDLDRSRLSSLDYATALARSNDATIHLLHIVPTENLMLRRDIYRQGPGNEGSVVRAEKVARQALEEIARARFGDLPYEVHVHVSADPAKTILEIECDIRPDLIVMVTQGFGGLVHLIVGSVTESVIRNGYCPVLSVRAGM
jgi:universal stress protein A